MPRSLMRAALVAAGLAGVSLAALDADAVTSIPGWGDPFRSAHFSGYLNVTSGKRIHYHLVEAEDVADAPLVVWLNGGPGCSSYIGFWTENGPFTMNGDGSLSENPGRWTLAAHVLWLEAPVAVGFSYQVGASLPIVINDTTTAQDNLDALLAFSSRFPRFASTPLWIAGESYAGACV